MTVPLPYVCFVVFINTSVSIDFGDKGFEKSFEKDLHLRRVFFCKCVFAYGRVSSS